KHYGLGMWLPIHHGEEGANLFAKALILVTSPHQPILMAMSSRAWDEFSDRDSGVWVAQSFLTSFALSPPYAPYGLPGKHNQSVSPVAACGLNLIITIRWLLLYLQQLHLCVDTNLFLIHPERGGGHMISTDDLEYPREYRTLGGSTRRFSNVGLVHTSEHRHQVLAAQSLETLTNLHKADLERKRDVFIDHLKNKYPPQHSLPPSPSPSHGSMRGPAERSAREQQQPNYWSFKSRSPRHSQSTQSGLADQASKLSFASAESLETMSEADMPLGFNRMNRFRQSLPLSRSASQNKLRSPGVLFLQFGDETRRVHITHELNSLETLHALIVHMFPQKLTAGMLKSPNTAILIKDEARNVFYELEDVRDIQDRSIIKIYRKEPIYASYPAAHLANGDLRREMVYTSRDSSPTRRLNTLPSSTASHSSGSPSRSRLSYSGSRPPSFAGPGHPHPQAPQHQSHPHHASPSHGQAQGMTPSSSAILERRDVKPDEEMSAKNMVLLKNEGLYADPYSLVHDGRLSITSTQSLATIADPFGFPVSGGLYRRGSVRSLSTYSAAALQNDLEDSIYKPGGSLYSDAYSSSTLGMGFRLAPSSPQKIPDVQLRDRDSFTGSPSRGSPVRTTFRKDSASSSVFVESPKSRPSSSSEPLGDPSKPGFGSPLSGGETDARDRMEAMEKQIASLTGLVQSVLTRAPDSDSTCGLLRLCMMAGCPPDQGADFSRPFPFSSSDKTESTSDGSATGTLTPSAPLALMPPPSSGGSQASTVSRLQMQLHLHDLQQNASDLRKQLTQLRKMQLQNQDSVRSLLKRTETELSLRLADALRKQEDPLQRQRLLVEEERLKYLNQEELIIQQLHDLEKSVDEIQKEMSVNHRNVTVQELEEKSSMLRKLGETLTELKNQFPGLQSKMRVVLRVEVEAVKFLKEEPHRLDALLKRCKSITDILTTIKRQVNEGVWKPQDEFSSPSAKLGGGDDFRKNPDFEIPTSPPLSLNDSSLANWSPHSGQSHTHIQREKDSHGLVGSLKARGLEELAGRGGSDGKASSVEVRLAAERDWEEKRASLTQYSAQDINRLLEETQAELMKAIPDLDFAAKQIKPAQNQNLIQNQTQNQNPNPSSTNGTPEHRPNKPQHKLNSKESGSRRGSDELTVARYRTEKPSKSPPPPPPRRSFPSSPGLTTRSGEIILPGKSIKKSESEEAECQQKPHIKLRRSISEAPRPASTPPTTASTDRGDGDNDKVDLETGGGKALSRLKHLQQSGVEKIKTSKQREDFIKNQSQQQEYCWRDQTMPRMFLFLVVTCFFSTIFDPLSPHISHLNPQTLSLNMSRARGTESLLSSTRAASFSGQLPSRLRKYSQDGALSSLTASSNQAKALLASLSTSSLSTEALLLSSTVRHHRLLREQSLNYSTLPASNGRSPPSPSSPTSSSSPSSPPAPTSLSLSTMAPKPSTNLSLEKNKNEPKVVTLDDEEVATDGVGQHQPVPSSTAQPASHHPQEAIGRTLYPNPHTFAKSYMLEIKLSSVDVHQ
ncbi:hypothetical protein DNTS_014368, partial [Danionella cerebrum]